MATTPNRGYPIPDPTLAIHPAAQELALAIDADVDSLVGGVDAALADPGSNGIVVRTALATTVARSLTQPAAGFTISNNDGVAGNPTFALAHDLAALEALSGTGFAKRTGSDAWSVGALVSGDIPDISATYATRAYADSLVVGLIDDRGNFDASGNAFPTSGGSGAAGAILKGDLWTISVAGALGGVAVNIGDQVRSLADTPGQTASNWAISEANIGYVPLSQSLADGKIYVGNGSGIGTAVTPSGDLSMSNAGAFTIAPQNSAYWRGKVTDETGVGLWVFNDSPTLITPVLGVASGTSLNLSGNLTVGGNVASHLIPSLPDTFDLGSFTNPWRSGHISELNSTLFAQNTISVIGGWLIVTKDEGTVNEDVDTSETQIDFGTNAIAANDFIVFRSAGAVEYMQAASLVSGTTWNVTRNVDGSGANAWPQGSVWVNFGYNGTGRIELNANSTPRIGMFTQGTTYNSQTELLRLGDLNTWGPYAAEAYGFATGIYGVASKTWETIEQTNGIRLGVNTTTLFKVDTSGNVAMGEVATDQGNVFWNTSNKRLEFRGSTAGTVVQAYVDTTGAITAGSGNVVLDANGIGIAYTGTQTLDSIRWLRSGSIFAQMVGVAGANGATWRTFVTDPSAIGTSTAGLWTAHTGVTQQVNFEIQNQVGSNSFAALGGHSSFAGIRIDNNDWSLVNTGPERFLDLRYREGTVDAFYDMVLLSKNSTGTPAVSYGASLRFRLESSTTEDQDAARVGALWTTATHASRTSAFVIQTVNNAGSLAEVARFAGNGDTTLAGSLFLAEGGVINWDNGDVTLTQAGDLVTLAGADLKVTGTVINLSSSSALNHYSAVSAFQLGGNAMLFGTTARGAGGSWNLALNGYFDNTAVAWKYISTDKAAYYQQYDGGHIFSVAASGTAGNNIAFATGLTIFNSGGVSIGAASDKGAGSIHAITVWRNGTSLDHVFEDGYDLLSIDTMTSYFRENKHLPTIPTREVHDSGSTDMGALTDRLWETVEVQALYISELHERLKVVESRT